MNKYGVEEKVNDQVDNIDNVKEKSLQDKTSDHFLDHYHKKYSLFTKLHQIPFQNMECQTLFEYWKRIKVFREFSDGYIDFNKWNNDSINEVIHSIYSKSDNAKRKLIMNVLLNDLSGNVIRVVGKYHSNFMTGLEIRSSIQVKFKNHITHKVITNLNASFGRILMIHGVKMYQKMWTNLMI